MCEFKRLLIPENSPKYNDAVDVVIQSATKTIDVEGKDGTPQQVQMLDEEKLWWKTNDVSNETFGRFAWELKEFERQASVAYQNMPKERADQIAQEIIQIGQSYRSSIDAKSSESRRDKHNSKSTLLDKISRNKVERVYTQKGEKGKSLLDSFRGKQQEKDMEED